MHALIGSPPNRLRQREADDGAVCGTSVFYEMMRE